MLNGIMICISIMVALGCLATVLKISKQVNNGVEIHFLTLAMAYLLIIRIIIGLVYVKVFKMDITWLNTPFIVLLFIGLIGLYVSTKKVMKG